MKNRNNKHEIKKHNNLQHTLLRTILLLAALAPVTVWGQTDYSGVYYIGSRGYVEANTTSNYYLCPTEGWAFYVATNQVQGGDNGQPFLTTYQCRNGSNGYDATKAVWIVEKEPNSGCYYIKQALTGKYMVSNGVLTGAGSTRARVHLETVANASALAALGDWALFEITYDVDHYDIIPHSTYGRDGANNIYLVVNTNNYNQLTGNDIKKNGPTGFKNCGGIIGLYTHPDDGNAKFYFEDAVKQPDISQAANGDITITCATGNTTIYYTLNGSDPVVPADGTIDPTDPYTYKYTSAFTPTLGSTGVKAVAVLSSMHAAVSRTAEHPFVAYTTPTISFNGLDQVTITAAHQDATIYYTVDGNDPVVGTSPTYSVPLTISTSTTVKAVATHTGFLTSAVANSGVLEPGTVDAPTVNYSCDNIVSLSVAVGEIYYNIGDGTQADPDNSSTLYENPFTPSVGQVIKAITYIAGYYSTVTSETYNPTHTAVPTIESDEGTVTITGPAGSTIYFTTDGTDPTTSQTGYSSPHVFTVASSVTVKAIAKGGGLLPSCVVSRRVSTAHSIRSVSDLANIANDLAGDYIILNDIDVSGFTTIAGSFTGTIEADIDPATNMPYRISGLEAPLFTTLTGTAKNLVIESVSISNHSGNTGAIACTANDAARIYNVGILGGSVGGSDNVGGLVGLLDGEARVINCYSYANITGGTNVGGIVGYNNVATASNNLKTMVFACMFYGNITGGTNKAAIYGGTEISNKDANGVSNFNYFRLEAPFVAPSGITYNGALGAEDRFLQRFEFYRHLLNGHRELAGWWATGTYSKSEMMKWVLLPDSIGTSHPYPILMPFGKYPSVVNIDAEHATTGKPRNQGGKLGTLTVNIQMGNGAVYNHPGTGDTEAKITTSQLTLNITDKDTAHYNFNYYKVQLPYYNDVGTKNYTGYRVVTGWKIVSITGGTAGTFSTSTSDAPSWNFADRNCTNKDLYGTGGSNRIFNQGAYWDVPEGVTDITIEPYWAKCVYLADANADKVYNQAMETGYDVLNVGGGQKYINGNSYSIAGDNQAVFTTIGNAIASSGTGNALFQGVTGSPGSQTVYDYAVVLVGNYHHSAVSNATNLESSTSKPYTVTSIDLDGDNEPDFSYILRFNGRQEVHPVRADFINIPGLGMAQKSTGGTGTYNFGIMIPKKWFESTNTSLFRFTQFEYEHSARSTTDAIIVQGGVMEQWVSNNQKGTSNKIPYIHVGGNVWFKEFHTGCHQDKDIKTLHSPVSVTGGDFDEFYLTGLYVSCSTSYADNAECYINGGRFGTVCGAAMEGIGKANGADNTGNITWLIQNADIKEFYAGALNAARPATGNLSTTIIGSHVGIFCGGPKFGDMSSGKTVTTTATDCAFGTFFGAGYGGNSYSRHAPTNRNNVINLPGRGKVGGGSETDLNSWNAWLAANYTQAYNGTYGGVSTQFNYQFLPMSSNIDNVARIFVEYVKFSLATTRSVTSSLTNCTIDSNFYGGGSLGKVEGNVISTLDNCTVRGNVFGAGFSASLPPVEVDSIGFRVEPYYYEALGTYRTGIKTPNCTTYTWRDTSVTVNSTATAIDKNKHFLYTNEDLNTLGTVQGNVTLTLKGNTTVGTIVEGILKTGTGNVFGGGDESGVLEINAGTPAQVKVILQQGAHVLGNVYGGGNNGPVGGSSEVRIQD